MGKAAGKKDLIHLTLEDGGTGADLLGDLIGHGLIDLCSLLIAAADALGDLPAVVGTQISHHASAPDELLPQFCLGIFTGEAKVHHGAEGQSAAALRRHGAVAVKAVVHIHQPSLLVGAHGNAAPQMGDDEVVVLILTAQGLGRFPAHRFLIQWVIFGLSGDQGSSGIPGQGFQFIHDHRIYHIGVPSQRLCDGIGDASSQIGGANLYAEN